MELFHETNSFFYEMIVRLINSNNEGYIDENELKRLCDKFNLNDEYEVLDDLIINEPHIYRKTLTPQVINIKKVLFGYSKGRHKSNINHIPIRNTLIENQTLKGILFEGESKYFLNEDILEKIKLATKYVTDEWHSVDVSVKHQYVDGDRYDRNVASIHRKLETIIYAINVNGAIECDNVKEGFFCYEKDKIYPVKIEYSYLNDKFRVIGYHPNQKRFIKMNLSTMSNIRCLESDSENYLEEYINYVKENTKKVKLKVEPTNNAVERCFRIFSYYDKQASYDEEKGDYTLSISYLKHDEKEIVKNILTLGGNAIVLEPEDIKREVIRKIMRARDRYR